MQDAWRRLKNKSAIIYDDHPHHLLCLAFGSAFFSPHNLMLLTRNGELATKMAGVNINGLNGTLVQAGSRVNAYQAAGAGAGALLARNRLSWS